LPLFLLTLTLLTLKALAKFNVKEAGKIKFVNADDIEWIKAAGNYVELFNKD